MSVTGIIILVCVVAVLTGVAMIVRGRVVPGFTLQATANAAMGTAIILDEITIESMLLGAAAYLLGAFTLGCAIVEERKERARGERP